MLILEDLLVANLAVRRNLVDVEALRRLLAGLDAQAARVPLARAVHDRLGVELGEARLLHEQAQRKLRQRAEERYLQLMRREPGLDPALLDRLAAEQAQAGWTWALGERLVRQHGLPFPRHEAVQREAMRQLIQDEARLLEGNRQGQWAQALGRPAPGAPPASGPSPRPTSGLGSGLSSSASDRLWASSPDARPFAPPPGAGPEARGTDPRGTSSRRVAARFDPAAAPGPTAEPPLDPDRTVTFPGRASPGPSWVPPPPGPPADGDRTITLPAGGAAAAAAADTLPPDAADTLPPGAPLELDALGPTLRFPAPSGSQARPRPLPPGVPARVGRYEVTRELGRGAMGLVVLGRDPERGPVAIKLVQGPANEEARGRFQREILVSRRLQHPHVIAVLDAGELPDGSSFMVMELLEGRDLRKDLTERGPRPVPEALDLLEQLLRGLDAVHAANVVHRDLKPDNLHLGEVDGRPHLKLVDFGISRFLDQDQQGPEGQVFMTVRGTLSGTPQYVAPEAVLDPEIVSTSHDVYAAGVILFELLTGQLPFPPARSLRDILADTLNTRPRDLAEAHPPGAPYPPPLERFVRKLLEKDPEARPRDAAAALALLAELRADLGGGKPGAAAGADGARGEGFTARLVRRITGLFRRD